MIIIQWTTNNIEEARKISRILVDQRYVACASIIPIVESIYIWEGKRHEEKEVKVIFKTCKEAYSLVEETIKKNTSYEVPEILATEVFEGNKDYMQWLNNTIKE